MAYRKAVTFGIAVGIVAGIAGIALANRKIEAAEPIEISIDDLVVSPEVVYVNNPVVISFIVTNISDYRGSRDIIIGGDINMAITVTLNPGESQDVQFTFVPPDAKPYQAKIDGLTATFTAVPVPVANIVATNISVSPTQVQVGQTVTITVTMKNTGTAAGSRTFDVVIT
jgi:hypothetical protein